MTHEWNVRLTLKRQECPHHCHWLDNEICINPMNMAKPRKLLPNREEKFILCNIDDCPVVVAEG